MEPSVLTQVFFLAGEAVETGQRYRVLKKSAYTAVLMCPLDQVKSNLKEKIVETLGAYVPVKGFARGRLMMVSTMQIYIEVIVPVVSLHTITFESAS